MKRISFLMIALVMSIGMIMAQGPRRGERKQIDPKARAERMTERMAKEYDLNESQKAKLLEVNLSMAEKATDKPMARPHKKHRGAEKGKYTCSCEEKRQDVSAEKPERNKEEREKRMAAMKEAREAYNTELKGIFTTEQYAKYEKNRTERMEKMKDANKDRKEKRDRKGKQDRKQNV